uniref:NADH-ubiquinone oxidoreductase chain 4L n=1 Tax=Lamproblatta sp. LA male TaxID=2093468 RepID=A0A2P1H9J5_9NEOP|nr:NADH dehydrogenase subunit 4L [Lamproblatta sp. LA male]
MFLYFCGLWVFSVSRDHFLIMLLSLEYMVLIVYLEMYIYLGCHDYDLFFGLVFISFSVCEGALGLSVLVSMVRGYGNDFLNSLSLLQC